MSTVLMLGFVALIGIGVPIAFAMGLATLLAIIAHGGLPFSLLAQRALVGADSYALLAIPFFILAGNLMNSGGITSRLIDFANAVVGRFRGGLAQTTVLSTMLFSGSPAPPWRMRRRSEGPDPRDEEAGLRSAVLGCPYGVLRREWADHSPIDPDGDLRPIRRKGSLGRGALSRRRHPGAASRPVSHGDGLLHRRKAELPGFRTRTVARDSTPRPPGPLGHDDAVIILVGVAGGIFTVTESAAVAVLYAAFVGLVVYRELRLRDLGPILVQTALDSALVMFIIALASGFGYLMAISGLPRELAAWISSISSNPYVILLLLNLLLLVVGCFMEAIARC
jgi:C4-dicarboxylate transporter DctM subunit